MQLLGVSPILGNQLLDALQVLSGEITLKVSVIAADTLLKLLPESCSLLQLRLRWPEPGTKMEGDGPPLL